MSSIQNALIRQFFEKRGYTNSLEAFNMATEGTTPVIPAVDLINRRTRKIAKSNKEREDRPPYKSLLEALVLVNFTLFMLMLEETLTEPSFLLLM
jgi:hypothetical protein